jgi:hypothetical protein
MRDIILEMYVVVYIYDVVDGKPQYTARVWDKEREAIRYRDSISPDRKPTVFRRVDHG